MRSQSRAKRQSLFITICEAVLGTALAGLGRYAEAEALMVKSYENVLLKAGESSADARRMREHLHALYTAWGKPAKAAEYRDLPDRPAHSRIAAQD